MKREKWFQLSYAAQISIIGCEVDRAIRCKKAGKKVRGMQRYDYAMELIDLTRRDPKNDDKFRELRQAEWSLKGFMFEDGNLDEDEKSIMEFWNSYIEEYLKERVEVI